MTFEEKVKSMTAKELVMAMVNGLKAEHINVDMDVYGDSRNGVCFGCAATNAICEIAGIVFDVDLISHTSYRCRAVGSDFYFFNALEFMFNDLRMGDVEGFNEYADSIGVARLKEPSVPLPPLYTENYKELLHYYETFANEQTP